MVIIFPRRMTTALSPEQLKLIFLHELAHVRRIDNLVLLLQRAVEMLLFFHPAVWVCGRMMRREAERACDDAVVAATGRHVQYADGLARVAESRQKLTGRLLVNAFAAAESDLSARVRRVLDGGAVLTSVRSRVLALIGLCLFAFLGLPMAVAQDGGGKEAEAEIRGVVTFADPQLEAVIREVVGKPEGELLAIDMRRIAVLHAPGQKIERLDGIEHLTMAQTLDFRENEIEDLSPLVQRGVVDGEIRPILTGSGEFMDEISYFLQDYEVRDHEPYFFRHDELTSMVVNPAGTNAERFVMFSAQLEIGNVATVAEGKEVGAQLGQYASLIKATLTEVMRSKTIEQMQAPGFKKVRREMQEALQIKVMDRIGERGSGRGKIEIREVIISDLIIQ